MVEEQKQLESTSRKKKRGKRSEASRAKRQKKYRESNLGFVKRNQTLLLEQFEENRIELKETQALLTCYKEKSRKVARVS